MSGGEGGPLTWPEQENRGAGEEEPQKAQETQQMKIRGSEFTLVAGCLDGSAQPLTPKPQPLAAFDFPCHPIKLPGSASRGPDLTSQAMNRQTTLAKNNNVEQHWLVIDATDQVLGRLATRVAVILMGKHKPEYTPHHDVGDFVIITNAEKIRLTGNKLDQKFYETYSGHPSGRKTYSYRQMIEKKPELLIEKAVRRMMPRSKLARHMHAKLKVYRGPDHPHQAQNPKPLELSASA